MGTYTENWQNLPEGVKDLERARQSMVEELDAISFYDQRIQSTSDAELKKVLAHLRDEEKEHAALLFKYIEKKDPGQAEALSKSNLGGK